MKRGRNQRRRPGNNPNRALDSNGPEVRIRGTANQIYDKYIALARDASSSGDRIKAENCLQHAEHYFRILRAAMPPPQSQSSQHSAPEGSTSEQPSMDNGSDRANEHSNERSDERRPDRQSRGRDRDERVAPRAEEEKPETAAPSQEAPVSTQDEDAPEAKPKRRRAKRTTKPAAKENDEASDVEEAAAAAE
ncbi:hypothetical protein MNBD_ALPHA05-1538 [hydrothermal vent metagenome]|uniref:DUF4167 domain-containing protein n=1 Tax=hydrothermal vent metagenome TaxID=652676 RepID=A0A3B0SQM1_9ZZZZ